MPPRDEILSQAMSLPAEDRAYVACVLEESLQEPISKQPDCTPNASVDDLEESAFRAELQRRSSSYRAGTTTARPASEVLADLQQRQAVETPR